mmetsp:Transcript_70916/g.189352  ORF Transcript_70916/g.189352 Transcript_70916/m.189352 type:complete len:217 (+) Transcript_70916:591-1241(+)
MAIAHEDAHGLGILLRITTGEALVGRVEEHVVVLLLEESRKLLPLLNGGIHTRGVVGAGMQHEDGALLGVLDVLAHTGEVEANGLLVIIAVGSQVQASILGHGEMVRPGGVRHVHSGALAEETSVELESEATTTSARKNLGSSNAVLLDSGRVSTEGKLQASGVELVDASDAGILLLLHTVPALLQQALLGLNHGGKHPGLAVVITIRTNAEVHLA